MREQHKVIVIGGGIGGLALAQGLRRRGVNVALYERDRTRTDRLRGYRLHLNPTGDRALRECLPPPLYQTFVDTTGRHGAGFGFVTEGLRPLLQLDADSLAPGHHSVSRMTLRQVLLTGLDDVVHFDKRFVRYEHGADGRVTAHFADGTTVIGDVLVGADGVGSAVRRQYLPHAEVVDTGVLAIAGKTPLDDHTRAVLPGAVLAGPTTVIPPRGCGMFIAVQQYDRDRVAIHAAAGGGGLLFDDTADYVMWAYAAPRSWCSAGPGAEIGAEIDTDPRRLYRTVLRLVDGWHPGLRRLVAEADPETVSAFPIRSSVPVRPWPATNVTLLGDAIHSMTPMRGIGANVALRDAGVLAAALAAADGGQPLLRAVGDYERQMTGYGFAAVRASLQATRQFTAGPAARVAFRAFLRVVAAVPPLRRKLFAGFGEG